MRAHRIFITVVVLFLISLNLTAAQIPGSDTAELDLAPAAPGPNQTVTVSLQSYLSDLSKAQISWAINGQTIDSGIGMKRFSFKTGALGSKTEVSVMAITVEGYPLSRKLVIYPAKVDLVYESDSYTPPFYKGRAYFPYGGSARVIAAPSFVDESGTRIPNQNLLFKWKDSDKYLEEQSGYGRSILVYKNRNLLPKAADISVEISTADNKFRADASLTIDPVAPKVVLYEKHPLYGILYNKALRDTYSLKEAELSISAVPFYFGVGDTASESLKYEWSLNGNPVSGAKGTVVLKRPMGSSGGTASLSLQLSNRVDYFQFGNAQLSVNFNGTREQ